PFYEALTTNVIIDLKVRFKDRRMNQMNNIPAYIFNRVCELIPESTKDNLHQYLYKETVFSKEQSVEDYIQQILEKFFLGQLFDPAEIRSDHYRKKQTNKMNWVKSLKKDVNLNRKNPI